MGKKIVIDRYCDIPMAIAMGIKGKAESNLPRCNKKCAECLACIEVDSTGERSHVNLQK